MSQIIPFPITRDVSAWVAAAQSFRPLIDENREAIARGPDLPQSVAEALIKSGMTQLWLPRSLGGPELDFLELFHAVEALAKQDGSVAWIAMISSVASRFASMISSDSMRRLLPAKSAFSFSGSGHPSGSITRDGAGWRISGRWTWMSFSRYSDIFALVCREHEDGVPLLAATGEPVLRGVFLPSEAVQVLDNWNSGGLRSTGSHDVTCTDVWVNDDCTTSLDMPDRQPSPLYDLPAASASAVAVMGLPLGIASASIDTLIALAGTKVAFTSSTSLRDHENVQLEVAWAKTRLQPARAFATEVLGYLWASMSSGKPASVEEQGLVRMACRNAGDAGKEIVGRMYAAAGSTAMLEGERFGAQLRDVFAACQHINFATRLMVTPGRILLGLDPGTTQI